MELADRGRAWPSCAPILDGKGPGMLGAVTCRECGASGCRDLFDRLLALEFKRSEPYGRLHGVTVPAWFLQHPRQGRGQDRDAQWEILHLYARSGLGGVDALVRRRRAANSHRNRDVTLPDAPVGDVAPVPAVVATGYTIAEVAGPGRDFPADGHEQRVRTWTESIITPPGDPRKQR